MSRAPIDFRPATQADVAALERLLRRSWPVAWAPELPFEAVQRFAAFDPVVAHAGADPACVTVAERGDDLVGMGQVVGDSTDGSNVDPAPWGGSVGSRLMDEAEDRIARSHAFARLEVRAFNRRAIAFYRRRGWIEHRRCQGTECGSPVENPGMRKALRL